MRRLAASCGAALAAGRALACPLSANDGALAAGNAVSAAWRTADGTPVATGRPLELVVTVCPSNARLLQVDATMPEHRHGMNYRPSLIDLGAGRWRVQGMLLHMAGRWELRFDVESGSAVRESLRDSVYLK
jgi:hypothetical protein